MSKITDLNDFKLSKLDKLKLASQIVKGVQGVAIGNLFADGDSTLINAIVLSIGAVVDALLSFIKGMERDAAIKQKENEAK